mgnify:CR=1 FL=1|tara:strand:- start:2077 stop:2931 length:855 start_codon:yes stop_codon:yes gene_type:complete
MKKKKKLGDYLAKGPKKLQFGDPIPGGSRRRAAEGDKTYTKAVRIPAGFRAEKNGKVYDGDGNLVGRRVAGSRPMYLPNKKNAGTLSRQGAENINRSRGRTRAEMDAGAPSNRDAGRQQPSTPSPAPRRPRPAPAPRRPEAAPEKVAAKGPKAVAQAGPSKSLKVAKPAAKPAAPVAEKKPSGRAGRISARAERRAGRIKDRRAKKAGKSGMRAEVKSARAAGRKMVKEAKGKAMMGKMMKYKPGGAKPDYLDMDKDGNKNESMKKALKDRRKMYGGYGKKKKK